MRPVHLTVSAFICSAALAYGAADISGTVLDADTGKGLAGARARLICASDDPLYARSDSDGRFRFDGVSTPCTVAAELPGYAETKVRPNTFRSGIGATPGRAVEIKLARYGIVEGVVVDSEGIAVAEADVELSDGTQTAGRVRTDDRGRYRLAPLGAGTYSLRANPSWELQNDSTYRPTEPLSVEVEPGKTERVELRFKRVRGVRVAGSIAGAPPAVTPPKTYSVLTLTPENEARPRSVQFHYSWDNRFAIPDVLPGRYVLETVTKERGDTMDTLHDPVLLGARQIVDVGEKEVDGLVVEMQPAQTFEGVVSAAEGCAPAVLRVQIQGSRLMLPDAAAAVTNGRFRLGPLPPGHYRLSVGAETGWYGTAVSMRLGDVEIEKQGFDVPSRARDLRIVVTCPRGGVR